MRFKEAHDANDLVKRLINNTVLGSNGARYRHLHVAEHLKLLDNPLFFSLESTARCFGAICLCHRGKAQYLRYFTFDSAFQSALSLPKTNKPKNATLKKAVENFFNRTAELPIYAYIEPENMRSLHMAKQFSFEKWRQITLFHFSRIKPKANDQLLRISYDHAIPFVREAYKQHAFYYENEKAGTFYGWKTSNGLSIIVRVHKTAWEIKSLKGKYGAWLAKLIPFIPLVRNLIVPKQHTFIALDSLVCISRASVSRNEVEAFFSALLSEFKVKHMMFWCDESSPVIQSFTLPRWGILQALIGKTKIHVVVRGTQPEGPLFINAFDLM